MKHNLKITIILVLLFLAAQLIGLIVINHYISNDLPLNIEKPEMEESTSFVSIIIGILIATILAFILIRFKAMKLWKIWFFISVVFCLIISFGAFFIDILALALAVIFAFFKIFKPNVYVHNFTELFIYGGLAAIFIPILNLISVSILIIAIAIYDAIAVWKTKHMIKLAKFQAKSKMFAGLLIKYKSKNIDKQVMNKNNIKIKEEPQNAILGGGDIGIPLLFSGVILKTFGMLPALISIIVSTIVIASLFLFAEKKKLYTAIPFLAVGCLISYILIILFI